MEKPREVFIHCDFLNALKHGHHVIAADGTQLVDTDISFALSNKENWQAFISKRGYDEKVKLLEQAMEVIEFYADAKNWDMDELIPIDRENNDEDDEGPNGKRARMFLKMLKRENK